MSGWTTTPFANILVDSKDGEWGDAEGTVGSRESLIVRATDFADLNNPAAEFPRRWVKNHIVDRKGLQPGDLILETAGGTSTQSTGRTALLRKTFFEHHSDVPVLCASFSRHLRLDTHRYSPRFIYYLLQVLYRSGYMAVFNIQHTGVSRFQYTTFKNHTQLQVPELLTQHRIAGILSAYDELIENNRRRIALLEKLAAEVYREWFVRLRFPGHETAKSAKGLPEGWRRRKVSDFARCKSGYTESALINEALPKFLRVMDINKASFISWSAVPNCHISDVAFQKVKLTKGDVVIARMADPGKVAIVEQDVNAVFASYLIKIAYEPTQITPYYLFYTLSSNVYAGYFAGANSGATRGSINGTLIGNTQIVVPKREVMEQFDAVISPIREQLSNHVRASEMLAQIRDKMLPRLVSGKLSVEHLTIEFPPGMAEEVNAEPTVTVHA